MFTSGSVSRRTQPTACSVLRWVWHCGVSGVFQTTLERLSFLWLGSAMLKTLRLAKPRRQRIDFCSLECISIAQCWPSPRTKVSSAERPGTRLRRRPDPDRSGGPGLTGRSKVQRRWPDVFVQLSLERGRSKIRSWLKKPMIGTSIVASNNRERALKRPHL
jgi:hypothetical protein